MSALLQCPFSGPAPSDAVDPDAVFLGNVPAIRSNSPYLMLPTRSGPTDQIDVAGIGLSAHPRDDDDSARCVRAAHKPSDDIWCEDDTLLIVTGTLCWYEQPIQHGGLPHIAPPSELDAIRRSLCYMFLVSILLSVH